MTRTTANPARPPKTYERFVAVCAFIQCGLPMNLPCLWSDRKGPAYHTRKSAARSEAAAHAVEAGHVAVREVKVERRVSVSYAVVE